MTLLGHDRLATTEIYLNLSPEDAIRKFQNEWWASPFVPSSWFLEVSPPLRIIRMFDLFFIWSLLEGQWQDIRA
jgi:hypothetical protein